jgi:hypothetical protein
MDKEPPRLKDSALYRIADDVGFNARVEPIWYTFSRLESRMGFMERWREKRRMRRLIANLNAGLKAQGVTPDGWDERTGSCVCNLRVAKTGLMGEFRNYLRNTLDSEAVKGWPHLMVLRDRACYILPHDFAKPMTVSPSSGEDTTPVLSAAAALRELDEVNRRLRIDETFQIKKMVDFLDAAGKDIQMYESRFGSQEGFWPRFAYVLARKLAEVCAQRGLPGIVA